MSEKKPDYERDIRSSTREVFVLAVLIVMAWAAFAVASKEPLLKGTYGDSFGMLTALFTGLALAGLWYTIRLQRIELAATRDVLGEQSQSLRTQVLEGTFFQLLRRLSEVQEGVQFGAKTAPGRQSIRLYYDNLKRNVESELQKRGLAAADPRAQQIVLNTFSEFLQQRQAELRHYFRVIYHLFKFIRESDLTEDLQVRYANLARAQLSSYELCLLFYNRAVGEGKEGMKPLIEQFGLLKHVDASLLVDEKHKTEWQLYAVQAFMSYDDRKNVKVGVTGKR